MTRPLFLLGVLFWASISVADDPTDGKTEGTNLATNKRGGLDTILATDPTKDSVPGFAGTSKVPQAKLGHDQLINAGDVELDETGEKVRGAFGTLPDWDEPASTTAYGLSVQDDPLSVEGLGTMLNNNYESCEPVVTPATSSIDQFCDGWQSEETETCTIMRGITVHANDRFECSRDNPRQRVNCTRTLTKYCSRQYESQKVTDVLENLNVSGLASYENEDGSLNIGRRGDNYWRPEYLSCELYVVSIQFDIPNLGSIDEFSLTDIWYDDWNYIRVNNEIVYLGPDGDIEKGPLILQRDYDSRRWNPDTDWWEYRKYIVQRGNDDLYGRCELNRSRHIRLNLDILPYLREGSNTIRAYTYVSGWGGAGEFAARFATSFRKCSDFREQWSEQCE